MLVGALGYVKADTTEAGKSFTNKMNEITNTNAFVQTFYQLFYQYYQYYQIKNFPEQIIQIQ